MNLFLRTFLQKRNMPKGKLKTEHKANIAISLFVKLADAD